MTMLWLALHLPQLSLEALCASLSPQARSRPVVLITGQRVSAVNAAAAQRGIRTGLKRATALALAAELLAGQADDARDAAALQAVVHVALAFTPCVTLHDAQTVLLEVQASLRYFGGQAALVQRLAAALAPLGHRVQMAAAPTALGAAWLAIGFLEGPGPQPDQDSAGSRRLALGAHTTQLAALQRLLGAAPVGLLGPAREQGQALQDMGLHSLADLRRLPRAGLARRFGAALLDELDRAWGLQPDPRVALVLPAVFESRLELGARADSTEQVLCAAAVLLERLVAWAQAQQSRVAAFTLVMRHEPRHRQTEAVATDLHIALAEPALDTAHLQLLLRERLANCQLLAPTLELRLHCQHLVQAAAPNGELFPTRASESEGLGRLLERLRARLGDAQVLCLLPVADHRPERASRAVAAQETKARRSTVALCAAAADAGRPDRPSQAGPGSPLPLHRPAWLLPEPLALAERNALPLLDGRPLQLVSGPERIEAGWWDGASATRDYFIALAEDGSLVWVWRARLPAAPTEASWFLQGRFA